MVCDVRQITVTLGDEQIARLRALAERLQLTTEQAAAQLLSTRLGMPGAETDASEADALEANTPGSPFRSALDLSGLVDDPTIAPLTAADIERLLGFEAQNPH